MKTIKEISEHFAEVNNLLEASWGGKEDEIEYEHLLLACKQTAEYIQKWIPVSEELPEMNKVMLLGAMNNRVTVGYLHSVTNKFIFENPDKTIQVTHWRPINLK